MNETVKDIVKVSYFIHLVKRLKRERRWKRWSIVVNIILIGYIVWSLL